jgi:hypothetical protein
VATVRIDSETVSALDQNLFRIELESLSEIHRDTQEQRITGMEVRGRFEFAGTPRSLEGLPRIQNPREPFSARTNNSKCSGVGEHFRKSPRCSGFHTLRARMGWGSAQGTHEMGFSSGLMKGPTKERSVNTLRTQLSIIWT